MNLCQVKETLNQLSITSIEIHVHFLNSDTDNESDGPIFTHQDIPSGLDYELHTQLQSYPNKLPPQTSNRVPSDCILPILYSQTPEHSKTQKNMQDKFKVNIQPARLDQNQHCVQNLESC